MAGIPEELAVDAIVCDLVRLVMAGATARPEVAPEQLADTDAKRWLQWRRFGPIGSSRGSASDILGGPGRAMSSAGARSTEK